MALEGNGLGQFKTVLNMVLATFWQQKNGVKLLSSFKSTWESQILIFFVSTNP